MLNHIAGIVIEELDHQKLKPAISHLARAASAWLLAQFRADHPCIRGQMTDETLKNAQTWKYRLPGEVWYIFRALTASLLWFPEVER